LGDAPVCIVGGGVVGVSCSYYLRQAGFPVMLLDAHEICSGASAGNLGLLAASHSVPLATPSNLFRAFRWLFWHDTPLRIEPRLNRDLALWLVRFTAVCRNGRVRAALQLMASLNLSSIEMYAELERSGLSFGYEHSGTLEMFATDGGMREGEHLARDLQAAGLRVEVFTAELVRQMEPRASAKVRGGLYYADDANIEPRRFVHALAERARSMGADIREQCEITGFKTQDQQIVAVCTSLGTFDVSGLVMAAGVGSTDLLSKLGIRSPIQPARGYSFDAPLPDGFLRRPVMLGEAKVLLTPMGEKFRIGGILDLSPLDSKPSRGRALSIQRRVHEFLDMPTCLDAIPAWSGARPCTPDGLPLIGWSKQFTNLMYATGHGMLGVSLGPITARIVAKMFNGDAPDSDLRLLEPGRFGG
jgi:D-amino-acid dehydrogenase